MFKIIGSADPKYLAATDILIGDMSNTNYEFLLFDRPIILLANEWVRNNFPDIGIKTDNNGLFDAIMHCLQNKEEYRENRRLWLKRTISVTGEKASKRFVDAILERCQFGNPKFCFVHGHNSVRKTNLLPIIEEVKKRGFSYRFCSKIRKNPEGKGARIIVVGAHVLDLPKSEIGFNVHIDHDLKGVATANLEQAAYFYRRNRYFPHIKLHLTAGEAGERRTKLILGPLKGRTYICGYPKGDHLLRLNTNKNKKEVYRELGLHDDLPLVTYAPAGKMSYMKPGGSLTEEVIEHLKDMSRNAPFHMLIKLKYGKRSKLSLKNIVNFIRNGNLFGKKLEDNGEKWRSLFGAE